jgi:hypothetical protein
MSGWSGWPRLPWSSKESPRGRAASPSGRLQDVINRMTEQERSAIMQERASIDAMNEEDRVVSVMIEQINQLSSINIDESDPRIRFIIKQIIIVHGFTGVAIEKIQRCRPLLSAISNAIAPDGIRLRATARRFAGMVRRGVEFTAQQTALLAGQGLQFISDRIPNVMMGREPSPQGRGARSRSRSGSRSRPQAAVQIAPTDFVTRALSGLYGVLSSILNRAYDIIIQQCSGVACTAFTRLQRALSQGVNEAAPAAPAECAICMENAYFIGDNNVDYGPLGYIERHRNGAVGHPDRFHRSCLQGCHNICPMCRAEGPLWSLEPPPGQRQGGGGLKKYRSRSRSKSKSKSKSRRYISKPRKSRKAGKRIRHYSSRRK